MTLRIDRVGERVRLSGDLRSEHLHQVKAEMDQCGSRSVLDLEEVDRVDVEAVHLLNSCEARGVSVLNASAYIRSWMAQEKRASSALTVKAQGRTPTKAKRKVRDENN
jgi:ABC-type transporter Mla MlaB component